MICRDCQRTARTGYAKCDAHLRKAMTAAFRIGQLALTFVSCLVVFVAVFTGTVLASTSVLEAIR
jgi:hypothetical protein